MDTPTPSKTKSFSHQAAKLSWVCPIIVFLLLMFGRQAGARVIIELVSLLLIVVGFVFGVVALFGIRTHGKSGILAPAIVGSIIFRMILAFALSLGIDALYLKLVVSVFVLIVISIPNLPLGKAIRPTA